MTVMRTSRHRLRDSDPFGGDVIEKRFWPILEKRFPNYEVFWANVIWDLTHRADRSGNPLERFQLAAWLPREIQILCQCHYTIFRSLAYIGVTKDLQKYAASLPEDLFIVLENERMKNIYSHFGVVRDMTNRIAAIIIRIEEGLAGKSLEPKHLDELQKDLNSWFDDKYPKAFERFLEFHRPVSIPVHGRSQDIGQVAPPDTLRRYRDLFEVRLSRYRNLLHDANMGRVYYDGIAWVPKPEFLHELALWTDMMAAFSENRQKFESLANAMESDFERTLDFLNDLWDHFLSKMDQLQGHPDFKSWIEHQKPVRHQEVDATAQILVKKFVSTSSDSFPSGAHANGASGTIISPSGQMIDPNEK